MCPPPLPVYRNARGIPQLRRRARDKQLYYELSVQSPKTHVDWFVTIFRELRGRYARRFREDFCGTFRLSCEWVKRNRQNTADALDLDGPTLQYGLRRHYRALSAEQKKRLRVLEQDVRSVTSPKADLAVACNFSFNVFKDRGTLVDYLRLVLHSLSRDGCLLLEVAGGPGMIERVRERKFFYRGGKWHFTYIWDQKEFDPVTHEALYAIHFKFPDGSSIDDAFTYDWRLWTLPELREALAEAGFARSVVYWETSHRGTGTGEYQLAEKGENDYAWVAYVVGLK